MATVLDARRPEDSSWGTVKMQGNFGEGAIGGAAAGFYKIPCGIAHFFHAPRITKQLDPRHADVLRASDLHGSTRGDKARSDFREIFHRGAKDRNLAKGCRLQDVMPAGGNQGAADKRAIRQSIKRSK